jgi:hypothetical protein
MTPISLSNQTPLIEKRASNLTRDLQAISNFRHSWFLFSKHEHESITLLDLQSGNDGEMAGFWRYVIGTVINMF